MTDSNSGLTPKAKRRIIIPDREPHHGSNDEIESEDDPWGRSLHLGGEDSAVGPPADNILMETLPSEPDLSLSSPQVTAVDNPASTALHGMSMTMMYNFF